MLSSLDDTYVAYLQHAVTDGAGVDEAVVRQTLKSLGFSDRKVAQMLGEAESCCSTTDTSTSTTSRSTTSSHAKRTPPIAAAAAAAAAAQPVAAAPSQVPPADPSSASTSSPPTTVSSSVTSSSASAAILAATATAGAGAGNTSASQLGLLSSVPHAEDHQHQATTRARKSPLPWRTTPSSSASGHRESHVSTYTSTNTSTHESTAHDEPSALLMKLEAMHALLTHVSLTESSSLQSTPPSSPPHPQDGETAHSDAPVPCRAPSTTSSSLSDSDVNQGDNTRHSPEAHDITASSSSELSSHPHTDEEDQAHALGNWRQSAPPPLLTLAHDVDATTSDDYNDDYGYGDISEIAACDDGEVAPDVAAASAPREAPAPVVWRTPPRSVGPAFATYHRDMSRWVLSRRPVAGPAPSSLSQACTKHCAPAVQAGRAALCTTARRGPAVKLTAATGPNLHGVSMKPSTREQTRAATAAMGLPTTLPRRTQSDPVAMAMRYRLGWDKQERRCRQKRDAALWETRGRLVPTD